MEAAFNMSWVISMAERKEYRFYLPPTHNFQHYVSIWSESMTDATSVMFQHYGHSEFSMQVDDDGNDDFQPSQHPVQLSCFWVTRVEDDLKVKRGNLSPDAGSGKCGECGEETSSQTVSGNDWMCRSCQRDFYN